MTRDLITVTPETTVKELAKILTEKNISGVPVVDGTGSLIGVVTESDLIFQNKKLHIPTAATILDAFIFLESPDRLEQEIKKIAGTSVADIFTSEVVTVSEDTPIEELATIMSEKKIHTLPVLKGDELTGIIGKKDIIRSFLV